MHVDGASFTTAVLAAWELGFCRPDDRTAFKFQLYCVFGTAARSRPGHDVLHGCVGRNVQPPPTVPPLYLRFRIGVHPPKPFLRDNLGGAYY